MNKKKINYLKKNGFVVFKNMFPQKDCKIIADNINRRKKKLKNYKKYSGWEVIYNPFLISNELLNFINNNKIMSFIKNFLPKNQIITLNTQLATNSLKINSKIKKSAYNAHFVHSDFLFPFKQTTDVPEICVMIALDSFKMSNGATNYFKHSHLLGEKPKNNKKLNQVGIKPKMIELNPGSVVFTYGSTWHCVGKNKTGERRWAIQQRYRAWYYKPMFNYESLKKHKIFKKIKSNKSLNELFGFNSIVPNPNEKRVYTVTKKKL